MKFKRKLERAKMTKVPRHCNQPMLYKESYGDWICEKCGKIKHKPIIEAEAE